MFRVVELTRLWNAQHGGLYVIESPIGVPNPYLDVPNRDLVTTQGIRLTMINPAYMTRQIAELAEKNGIFFHITSRNPIRPANAPDPWESAVLKTFEEGVTEKLEQLQHNGDTVFRYMAPLRVAKGCMQCHAKQGYQIGEIRGGISITFAANDILPNKDKLKRNTDALYLLAYLLVSALIILFMHANRRRLNELDNINQQQEMLIFERTEALQREVAKSRQAHQDLEDSQHHLKDITATLGEGLYVTDTAGVITFINPAALRILGYHREDELLGEKAHLRLHHHHADGTPFKEEDCPMLTALQTNQHVHEFEDIMWNKAGEVFPVMVIASPLIKMDRTEGLVVAFRDISDSKQAWQELQRLNAELDKQAKTDMLTGIASRRHVQEQIEHCFSLSHRYEKIFSIIIFDIDWFKSVNDRFGHAVGDQVLQHITRTVEPCLREVDLLGRWGGEEFIILCPETRVNAAVGLAHRIQACLASASFAEVGVITASFGVAEHQNGEAPDEVIKRADNALYQAKAEGRNCVRS
ncbi:MAG: diguanylate cyclase [Gammaproteobacteria bacterium]|nr:diguanylate cyclase [Gammaproteobacteria bacterium]